ncbi:hypothetical protein OB13_16040 [Pontibacter sp. HJ8]
MEQPAYIVEDAAKVVYNNISLKLKNKLSHEEIEIILDIEFEFLEHSGVTSNPDSIVQLPIHIDENAMEYYVINQCVKEGIYLTTNEYHQIMDAETIYLKSLGLIDEEGLAPFYN